MLSVVIANELQEVVLAEGARRVADNPLLEAREVIAVAAREALRVANRHLPAAYDATVLALEVVKSRIRKLVIKNFGKALPLDVVVEGLDERKKEIDGLHHDERNENNVEVYGKNNDEKEKQNIEEEFSKKIKADALIALAKVAAVVKDYGVPGKL